MHRFTHNVKKKCVTTFTYTCMTELEGKRQGMEWSYIMTALWALGNPSCRYPANHDVAIDTNEIKRVQNKMSKRANSSSCQSTRELSGV